MPGTRLRRPLPLEIAAGESAYRDLLCSEAHCNAVSQITRTVFSRTPSPKEEMAPPASFSTV